MKHKLSLLLPIFVSLIALVAVFLLSYVLTQSNNSSLLYSSVLLFGSLTALLLGLTVHLVKTAVGQAKKLDVSRSAFIKDITEKRQLEQEIYHSQRMELVGQMTGGLAHDFNNLLMVIQGNLELLGNNFTPESKEFRRISAAIAATERGSQLTKRLLAFSRQQSLDPTCLDLKEFLPSLAKLIKPMLGDGIEIKLEIEPTIGLIKIDKAQLENALINIAINAKDAMQNQGKLTVSVKNEALVDNNLAQKWSIPLANYLKISLSDSGSGIKPEILPHIFEPFFTSKEVGKGTGLGLSMVYGFMQQSKGCITVASTLGQGTIFNLYLPLAEPEVIDVTENTSSEVSPELRGSETILIVDDEVELVILATRYLESLGYHTLTANNAIEALALLQNQTHKVDVIFTDVVMPSMTGVDLVREAKKLYPTIKFLFATGFDRNAFSNQASLGKLEKIRLIKPYKLNELAKKIRELVVS